MLLLTHGSCKLNYLLDCTGALLGSFRALKVLPGSVMLQIDRADRDLLLQRAEIGIAQSCPLSNHQSHLLPLVLQADSCSFEVIDKSAFKVRAVL